MMLSQQWRSLPRSYLNVLPPELPIPAHPLCPNTGTQHRPIGNGSTPNLTSPHCQVSVYHYFSQGSFCCQYLLFNFDGPLEPDMVLFLTLCRLVALTFMHRTKSCPRPIITPSRAQDSLIPLITNSFHGLTFRDPLSPPYLPGQFICFLASLSCPSLALTLTGTTPPAPVTDTTNTWLCPQVWTGGHWHWNPRTCSCSPEHPSHPGK